MKVHFCRAIPQASLKRLRQREEMKEVMGNGKRLNWAEILKFAEREDRTARNEKWKYDHCDENVP